MLNKTTMVEGDYSGRRRSTRKGTGPQRDQLFRRRLKQQRHKDMLFELREDGTYEMKEMSIREVFNYVQGWFGLVWFVVLRVFLVCFGLLWFVVLG